MADQPQSPNAGRISAMLQDLANQRASSSGTPTTPGPRPTVPPVNLPTTPQPQKPVPAAPIPPRPVMPPAPPGAVVPPRPVPPPAPKELPVSIPPKPAAPPVPAHAAPAPITSELRTMSGDIGQIQVGRPPSGVRPVAPVAPAATPAAPPIVVPTGGGSHRGRIILIGIFAVVIIAIAVAVVSSLGGGGTSATPTPSASPSPTATLSLQGKTLDSYFGKATGTDTTAPEAGLFRSVDAPAALSLPGALSSLIGTDRAWLIFGQNELYGSAGQQLTATTVEARSVAIYEISDVTAVRQAMLAWEASSLAVDAAGFLNLSTAHPATPGFVEGTYRSATVRFRNFPYPDHSIDWAIVSASNSKSYLTIAGSRQAIFAAVDALIQ